jgi:carbon-monoxide dehydrogenase large subunit
VSAFRSIGQSLPRVEDDALVRGAGRFLDDIDLPDCCAVAVIRSPYAHARFRITGKAAALAMPGVIGVYAAADLTPHLRGRRLEVALPTKAFFLDVQRPVLPEDEATYVGEALAVVVAQTRAQAEDAAEQVEIEFDPLPAVADCRDALNPTSVTAHTELPHNLVADLSFEYGSMAEACADQPLEIRRNFSLHRGAAHSLETRGVVSRYDAVEAKWTVWSSTQTPHPAKRLLVSLLGVRSDQVRVVAPDLGGGFGPKLVFYPEEVIVPVLARLLGRPVKWVEDRREHCVAATQERDQHWAVRLAVDRAGKVLGLDGDMLHEHGAYTARGVNTAYGSGVTVPLPYNVPAYHLRATLALTNKVPVTPVRGAGQPQAVFVMERLLDLAARELKIDRVEIRRRNLVRPEQMPCVKPLVLRGGRPVVLDSGDFLRSMERALQAIDWDGFPARQAAAREQGRFIGIGVANYVEGTGRGPYESVCVGLAEDGRVYVKSGAAAMGQGTRTMLAQIVAESLGLNSADIRVVVGDTDQIALGFGGFNSRQTVTAGSSAHAVAGRLRDRILRVAATLLGCETDGLTLSDGRVIGVHDSKISVNFDRLAREAVGLPGFVLPDPQGPLLEVLEHTIIDDMSYSNGCAVSEVEVDPETGGVRVLRYVIAHDCGVMVNPAGVDGQIIGGIAHGLGNALLEWMGFDAQAQPVSTTLADYLLITAAEMPDISILHDQSPSPFNELGLKGVGESGVIPTPAVIASAVEDALSPWGVEITSAPITPMQIRRLIREAGSARSLAAYQPPDWVAWVQAQRQRHGGHIHVK